MEILHTPKSAWITVNRACDMRCKWCYATSAGYVKDSDMNSELAKKIALLVKDVGIKTIVLIGGEPTLWRHLFDFNDFCSVLGLRTILVTNGRRFRSKKFQREFQQHPTTVVAPSLKAFDEQSSLSITGLGDFKGIKNGIRNICNNSKTYISIVYSALIQGRLLEMIMTAVELGAFGVRISVCTPMSENGRFVSPYTVDYDMTVAEFCDCYDKAMEITRGNLSFELKTPLCIWPIDFVNKLIGRNQIGSGCQFFHRAGVIFDTDGTVVLCNSMFDCPVGRFEEDFSDKKELLDLLNSNKVNKIYNHITAYPSKICVGCELYPRCRGGCPIMWTTHNAEEIISKAKNQKGDNANGKVPCSVPGFRNQVACTTN